MKILLDENIDKGLADLIKNHEVATVKSQGWLGLRNGELLNVMESGGFQVLITVDKNIRFQQNLKNRAIETIILDTHPIVLEGLTALVSSLQEALLSHQPGRFTIISKDGAYSP